jgi:hypothetical protein
MSFYKYEVLDDTNDEIFDFSRFKSETKSRADEKKDMFLPELPADSPVKSGNFGALDLIPSLDQLALPELKISTNNWLPSDVAQNSDVSPNLPNLPLPDANLASLSPLNINSHQSFGLLPSLDHKSCESPNLLVSGLSLPQLNMDSHQSLELLPALPPLLSEFSDPLAPMLARLTTWGGGVLPSLDVTPYENDRAVEYKSYTQNESLILV